MKKIISLITALMLSAALLAGCGSTGSGSADQTDTQENSGTQTQAEPVDVNVMALKGPTAMGMVKLMAMRTLAMWIQRTTALGSRLLRMK